MEIKGLFLDAMQDFQSGFYSEAIEKLKEIIKVDPKSQFADDSYYTIGLSYFEMLQFKKALEFFDKVINEFPGATIALSEELGEYGKIEAKTRYGKINAFLALGDISSAEKEVKLLEKFKEDSYIKTKDGKKKSFYELGKELVENYKKVK
ncbi:MAG: tetratricopeptide repeat protein [bacterium]|nr:tetratricopeptide repeat protein [bacterium]